MPGEGLTHGPRAMKKHGEGTTGSAEHPLGSTGRRNTSNAEVAMGMRKKRSTRARLGSLGRPPVAGRAEQAVFWQGIAAGLNSENAALKAGLSQAVGPRLFRKAGGMPAAMFRASAKPLSGRYLSLAEREEIALLNAQGHSIREIGRRLGRAGSTISRELDRNAATHRISPRSPGSPPDLRRLPPGCSLRRDAIWPRQHAARSCPARPIRRRVGWLAACASRRCCRAR